MEPQLVYRPYLQYTCNSQVQIQGQVHVCVCTDLTLAYSFAGTFMLKGRYGTYLVVYWVGKHVVHIHKGFIVMRLPRPL